MSLKTSGKRPVRELTNGAGLTITDTPKKNAKGKRVAQSS